MSEDRRTEFGTAEYGPTSDNDISRIVWPLLAACLLLALWLVYWQSNIIFNNQGGSAEVKMTPASEMANVSTDSGNGSTGDSVDESSIANEVGAGSGTNSNNGNSLTPLGIALNATLIVAEAATEAEDGGLTLYATASRLAQTREIYTPGDRFTLVEPSEDFVVYPVEVEGVSWVRVRDGDGLLGWADLSLLVLE